MGLALHLFVKPPRYPAGAVWWCPASLADEPGPPRGLPMVPILMIHPVSLLDTFTSSYLNHNYHQIYC